MAGQNTPTLFRFAVMAGLLLSTSFSTASDGPFLDGIPFFGKREVDPTIPERFRKSFKSTRSDIVMVFEGTRWHSLTNRAAKGSSSQQNAFCESLTRADRQRALIPAGFRYTPGGDGRVYLVKTASEPVVADIPPPARIPAKTETQPKETIRRAIVTSPAKPKAVAAQTPVAPAGSYRTALGNVLMVQKGDHWEGRAAKEKRGGLSAPEFCDRAAARDRLSGRLSQDHTYVLLADDTLIALPRSSQLARVADAR